MRNPFCPQRLILMSKKTKANLLLLITAVIWGSAFVAQSAGMEFVGPYTYNMSRSFLGFLVLIPVILVFSKDSVGSNNFFAKLKPDRITLVGGICCGIVLGVASSLQQLGISMTSAGKAGFITALYIILVPLLGVFVGKRIPGTIWICVVIAMCGFYLLCIKEDFSVSKGDLLVLFCSVCFAVHIMVIDYFTEKDADGVKMSCIQFLVAGILTSVLAFSFESPSITDILNAKYTILYAGILSSGVAYTLQIVAQKDTDPTTATLIMSLESVFAALSGWLILKESLSLKEIFGCVMVFAAVILAQIPGEVQTD